VAVAAKHERNKVGFFGVDGMAFDLFSRYACQRRHEAPCGWYITLFLLGTQPVNSSLLLFNTGIPFRCSDSHRTCPATDCRLGLVGLPSIIAFGKSFIMHVLAQRRPSSEYPLLRVVASHVKSAQYMLRGSPPSAMRPAFFRRARQKHGCFAPSGRPRSFCFTRGNARYIYRKRKI
jgi:hypothetical protein